MCVNISSLTMSSFLLEGFVIPIYRNQRQMRFWHLAGLSGLSTSHPNVCSEDKQSGSSSANASRIKKHLYSHQSCKSGNPANPGSDNCQKLYTFQTKIHVDVKSGTWYT